MLDRKEAGLLADYATAVQTTISPRSSAATHTTDSSDSSPRSTESSPKRRQRARSWAVRVAAGWSALLLAFVAIPFVVPLATAAASSCTNWSSRHTPPPTIRVLTDHNRVVVKNFRDYVAMVMASGEFPSSLPDAVLQAGATAVKQYAWYYALKGNHRPEDFTSRGVCFDVRSDTTDQLFKTYAAPTDKQVRAVDATWALTLRKGTRFFLTGYRSGTTSRCGADADGWHLYARSAAACARLGWSRQRIQAYYYAPHINFDWSTTVRRRPAHDSTPPHVQVPEVAPARRQPRTGDVAVTVSWRATDKSGISKTRLEERVDRGQWQPVRLSKPTQSSVTVMTHPGRAYQFRVRASDRAGNRSHWVAGSNIAPQVVQSQSTLLRGAWRTSAHQAVLGGSLSATRAQGPTARLAFQGSSIGVVAARGARMGKLRVVIDGALMTIVDLHAHEHELRRVVFSQAWSHSGTHTISVTALGTSGRPHVNLDAFVLLH
jgi:hypothetical protein